VGHLTDLAGWFAGGGGKQDPQQVVGYRPAADFLWGNALGPSEGAGRVGVIAA